MAKSFNPEEEARDMIIGVMVSLITNKLHPEVRRSLIEQCRAMMRAREKAKGHGLPPIDSPVKKKKKRKKKK